MAILKIACTIRYHYNVADARLAQHVERGIADGLLISCVASCSNLWALIMDAGTGFTNQVYKLSPFFLHKVKLYDAYKYISNFIICFQLMKLTHVVLLLSRNGSWSSGRRTITLLL